jgi:hypothetical protein
MSRRRKVPPKNPGQQPARGELRTPASFPLTPGQQSAVNDALSRQGGPASEFSVPGLPGKLRERVLDSVAPRPGRPPGSREGSWRFPQQGRPGDPDDTLGARLEAISPGLAARLRDGLGPEELRELSPAIAKAMRDAGAAAGAYSFSHGDPGYGTKIHVTEPGVLATAQACPEDSRSGRVTPSGQVPAAFRRPGGTVLAKAVIGGKRTDGGEGLPYGIQPGDIIAVEQPLDYADTGIALPPEDGHEPGSKVWRPAGEQLEGLDELLRRGRAMLDSGMSSEDVAAELATGYAESAGAGSGNAGEARLVAAVQVRAGAPLDETRLHPELRGTDPDTMIPVIISNAEDKPEGAGAFFGRLTRDVHTESGAVWPAGALVWRDTSLDAGEMPADRLMYDEDSGPVIARGRPARTSWTAGDVLNQHVRLAARFAAAGPEIASYLAHLMNASLKDDADQAGRGHWPVQAERERSAEDGLKMTRLIGRQLRDALTYQVTAPMLERMRQSEELLPGVQRLSASDLPAATGFAWLEDPWQIPVADGLLPVRALGWEKIAVPATVFMPGTRHATADAVRFVFWVYLPDIVAAGYFNDKDLQLRSITEDLGELIAHHVTVLPFQYAFTLKNTHRDESMSMIALIHSLWTYLGMELSVSRKVRPASAGHSKRVLRSLRHDAVHVVTLRHVSYIGDGPGGHRVVNRTCKWWVDDFYRHLDSYRDEDENGRPRRHSAVPSGQERTDPEPGDFDVCGVCLARGQTVRITQVHGHRRGPAHLPWRAPAKGRTVYRLAR